MKKKIKIIVCSLVVCLLLTGCGMRMNVGLEVSKDKDVKVKILSAMDNEMIDYSLSSAAGEESETKTFTDAERWAYLEKEDDDSYEGYDKEKYDQDGYKGYVYTKNLGNIDSLSTSDATKAASIEKIDENSVLFVKNGDVYSLNMNVDDDSDLNSASQYESMGAAFDLKLSITLPNAALTNNATTVSGNTYTWDLLKAKSFDLTFKLDDVKSSNNVWLIVGIAAGVVLVGLGVTYFVVKGKKNK